MKIRMLVCVSAVLLPALSFAHTGATGVVRERMEAMKDIASAMKTVAAMLRGKSAFEAEAASSAARTINAHAVEMPALFPKDSNPAPSEALPAIWENWQEFSRLATSLEVSSAELEKAATNAESAAGLAIQFKAVGQTCSGCHQKFRLQK